MKERVAVVGLGYVGLPVALAFARRIEGTVGFDVDVARVEALRGGLDANGEVDPEEMRGARLEVTADPEALRGATFFVVTVPTPVDRDRRPDLAMLIEASRTVGRAMAPGAVVVYESTVYPGVTEEVCGPELARASGLRQSVDFKLGYSPERINPGDRAHRLEEVVKVVAGEDAETLERVAAAYERVVEAGVHRAPSIKVAEAAKVLENTQRDVNIALMNELALILDRLGVRTRDVLDAAGTKWNFVPFRPGLVGGHCIGVDPYYLAAKAQQVGHHPEVILAGRRINDGMGAWVARRVVKLLIGSGRVVSRARVAVLGLTFKENVPDLRNSGAVKVLEELRDFGIAPLVHDPMADPDDARRHYGVELSRWEDLHDLDALVLAVPHADYRELPPAALASRLLPDGILADVTSVFRPADFPGLTYWSL